MCTGTNMHAGLGVTTLNRKGPKSRLCRPCAGSGIRILRSIPPDGPVLIEKGEVMTVAALEAWRQPPHSLELVVGTDYELKGGAVGGGAGRRGHSWVGCVASTPAVQARLGEGGHGSGAAASTDTSSGVAVPHRDLRASWGGLAGSEQGGRGCRWLARDHTHQPQATDANPGRPLTDAGQHKGAAFEEGVCKHCSVGWRGGLAPCEWYLLQRLTPCRFNERRG